MSPNQSGGGPNRSSWAGGHLVKVLAAWQSRIQPLAAKKFLQTTNCGPDCITAGITGLINVWFGADDLITVGATFLGTPSAFKRLARPTLAFRTDMFTAFNF